MSEEIKFDSPALATKKFAAKLTTKARELQVMEDELRIYPGQATEILDGMIQSFVWAVINTLRKQQEYFELSQVKQPNKVEPKGTK